MARRDEMRVVDTDGVARKFDRKQRIALCNKFDLVPAEDYRAMNEFNETQIARLEGMLKRRARRR